jgi:hypothetical protein
MEDDGSSLMNDVKYLLDNCLSELFPLNVIDAGEEYKTHSVSDIAGLGPVLTLQYHWIM